MKQLRVDIKKCTGCSQCVLNCSLKNCGEFDLNQSNIRLAQWEEYCLSIPVFCQHCREPACVSVCPVEAIQKDPTTGVITIDQELCISCFMCVENCKYQAMRITRDNFPATCNLCDGAPRCVQTCFSEALQYEEVEDANTEPLEAFIPVLNARKKGGTVDAPEALRKETLSHGH